MQSTVYKAWSESNYDDLMLTEGASRTYLKHATIIAALASLVELAAGLVMGIIVLVADGLHMLLDVVVLLSLYLGLGPTLRPPDLDHPYGHFKYRYLAMYTVAMVIVAASLWLIAEAIRDIVKGSFEIPPFNAIYVMAFVAFLATFRSVYLGYGSGRTGDVVLNLETKHALADLADALSVMAVVVASMYIVFIQFVAVFAISGYLLYLAYRYFRESTGALLDQVNPSLELAVYRIVNGHGVSVKMVRVKNVGNGYAVDLVVKMPGQMSIEDAHRIIDEVESDIYRKVPSIRYINTHVEPGD